MDFFGLVKRRRSVREYTGADVAEEDVERMLEAANLAPSAGNLQAYEIVVVREREGKERLAAAALEQEFIAKAPVVFVFFADPVRSSRKYGQRGAKLYALQDATIAASYLQLAAAALGLGAVWVGAFDEVEVRKAVGAPKELVPVAIIPVGHPAESPGPSPRRLLCDIAKKERF